MIRTRVSLAVAGAITLSSAFSLALAGPAAAVGNPYDPTISAGVGDLVGVGSDTSQIALHFLADGHGTTAGFNAGKSTGRIVSFAADGTPATISLRGGAAITRPNGSSAGKGLLYGASNNTDVTFARSSATLSSGEISANLLQAPFAVDGLKFAVKATGSNAPASVSIADAVKIYDGTYTTWNQIPGNSAGSTATIKPLIPQAGSGTRKFFEAQLKAANGGVAVNISSVQETQEHSDTDIKNDPNAIAPFSTGRAKTTPTIVTIGGFSAKRALYNVVRSTDVGTATVDAAFGETGFLCSPAATPLIEAAGFDQLASTSRGGECGSFGTTEVTNFKTSSEAADVTTTTLAATGSNGQKVRLTATVASATNGPAGTVTFKEGATEVGHADVLAGSAVLDLTGVTLGDHQYTASFVPTDATAFKPSASSATPVTVLQSSSVTTEIAPATSTYGKTHTVTVNVQAAGAPATGTVSVKVGTAAPVVLPLTAGNASLAIAATTNVGTRAVVATFAGNSSTYGSSSVSSNLTITAAKTTTGLKLKAKSVTHNAKAQATISVAITGTALKAGGKVTIRSGNKVVGTGVVKNGKVTINLAKLKKGTYSLKATFTGNANYSGSTSSVVKLKVT